MGVYEELGVKRLINAWGPMTIVGGSRMRPEVVSAMAEASEAFVDLPELQSRAGARIEIRPLPRAVHREKSQAHDAQVI